MTEKPYETSMYMKIFSYKNKRFYYVLSGFYLGYLCYTCGDGIIRSEFGNPINNKYVKDLVPLSVDDAKIILTLKPSRRAHAVAQFQKNTE